jgi:hypothetical protein
MALRQIKIEYGGTRGTVLHIFDPAKREEIVKQAERGLRSGATVHWEDGTIEWWEFNHRVDTSQSGSAQYTWKGDKVLADFVKVTRDRSGTVKKSAGTRFVALD